MLTVWVTAVNPHSVGHSSQYTQCRSQQSVYTVWVTAVSPQCGSPAVSPDSVGHNVVGVGQEVIWRGRGQEDLPECAMGQEDLSGGALSREDLPGGSERFTRWCPGSGKLT